MTTEQPPNREAAEQPATEPDRESAAGAPPWAKAVVVVIVVLVLLMFVVLHLSGALGPGVH